MPRFYFHLHNTVVVFDDHGRELNSLDEAKVHATEAARSIMAEDIKEVGRITLSHWIAVHTEDQEEALILPFSACVEIRS